MSRTALMFALLILLFSVEQAGAVTVEEAMSLALEQGEAVQITLATEEAQVQSARAGAAFTHPQLSFTGAYLQTRTYGVDSLFIQYPEEIASAKVTASQVLFAGGRVNGSLKLRDALVHKAGLEGIARRRDIKKRVRILFDKVLYQRALVAIATDRVEQHREERQDALDLRDAGMVTSLDVRQAELNLRFALDELEAAGAAHEQSLVDFNVATGRSGRGNDLVPEGDLGRAVELRMLIEQASAALNADGLLDMRAAQSGVLAAEQEKRVARGGYWPEVALVGQAETTNGFVGEREQSWAAGVQLNWEILDGGLTRAESHGATARLQAARQRVSLVEKELSGTIRNIETDAGALEQRIKYQSEAVELSELNYEDARGQYRAGMITQTRLGEFNLAWAESRFVLMSLYFAERQLLAEVLALLEGAETAD